MPDLVAVILLGLICWTFRTAFVLLVPAERLPAGLQRGLEYLAPAVLAGIAAVELTSVFTRRDPMGSLASLLAMALVAVVARVTRNLTAVVGVGLLAILVIDLAVV